MNTNIIMPPVRRVGSNAKEGFAAFWKHSGALHAAGMGLATTAVFASVAMATARERYPVGATQYYGLYQHYGLYQPTQHALSLSRQDRIRYHHSGTRGRDGLGGSPLHPEGPGNPSD
ncbi:hypothetical protein RZS28_03780 [Methylocapsa polymorpha]|uniref:Uncharacterized protein n=1 Tax=Methylocapsa polymorpha TaxID=3080828 RepID=A0ABZ0HUC5_9HYPH|nr:hypothetical protein RZS28_03780 [Methylocapsa sp. RX1]